MKKSTSQPHPEIPSPALTHLDRHGAARMVDVSEKEASARVAVASALVRLSDHAARLVRFEGSAKGDVLAVARLAGIAATKWTATLIPLCHAIPIEGVELHFDWPAEALPDGRITLRCIAVARTSAKTGVEMEAMTAAAVAALTIYDMLKAVDRAMVIHSVQLESKSGGRSGDYLRQG